MILPQYCTSTRRRYWENAQATKATRRRGGPENSVDFWLFTLRGPSCGSLFEVGLEVLAGSRASVPLRAVFFKPLLAQHRMFLVSVAKGLHYETKGIELGIE